VISRTLRPAGGVSGSGGTSGGTLGSRSPSTWTSHAPRLIGLVRAAADCLAITAPQMPPVRDNPLQRPVATWSAVNGCMRIR